MAQLTSRKSDCPTRPFHLWNATTNRRLASKFYSDVKRAHWGALKEMRWAKVGTTYEVLDVVKGKELGQYTRRVNSIDFTNGK
jgi:hypothetical protein